MFCVIIANTEEREGSMETTADYYVATDTVGCLDSKIKVTSGRYVDLSNPDPASIRLEDIAAALSKICRFGGHSPRFYSVAEHCVHATALASSDGFTGDALRAVFLHDATEAYVGDMVKPLKVRIPRFGEAERRFEEAIQSAVRVDFSRWKNVIKRFDHAMLKAEKTVMWPEDTEIWDGFGDIEDRVVGFQFWSPEEAEIRFMEVAETLQLVRRRLD